MHTILLTPSFQVEQFNKGVYNVIVAADEKVLDEGQKVKGEHKVDKDKDNSKRVKDKESGVARGIDFQFVANVINFDFPSEPDSYIHRYSKIKTEQPVQKRLSGLVEPQGVSKAELL